MKERTKNFIVKGVGIFLILFGLLAMYNNYFLKANPSGVFWICYWVMVFMGIAAVYKNSYVIAAQLNLLAISLVSWNIDFFYYIFTGKSLFGLVNHFFTDPFSLSKIISLEHLFILPLGILLLYFIKLDRNDFWKLSLFEIAVLYVVTILFTDPERNINCVFESCFTFIGNYLFPLVWFSLGILMTAITTIILVNIPLLNRVEEKP